MVVRWTDVAEERLGDIFDYYLDTAGHNVAMKIVADIVNSSDSLKIMPLIVSIEENLAGRKFVYHSLIVSRIFKIVYFIDEKAECVMIATIWDCRRNPSRLQKELLK
jgi:plasmid stabilization system protein ParE